MKKRFITYVKQIGPDAEKNTFWMEVMRAKLGTSGYGRKKVWVKLPEGKPGWKAKPGFGKLFFDYVDRAGSLHARSEVNGEATAMLHHADTVRSKDYDPALVVVGYAWFAPDEGRARPYFTLRVEHESEVRAHIIDTDEMAYDVHVQGRTLYVFPSHANGQDAAEWLREMAEDPGLDDEDKPSPEEIAEYAQAYDAFPTLARMRWA